MSAHRRNYTPEPASPPAGHGLLALAAIGALAVGVGALIALFLHLRLPAERLAPGQPDAQTVRLGEIREQAFRAGYASALRQACRPTALALPLTSGRAERKSASAS